MSKFHLDTNNLEWQVGLVIPGGIDGAPKEVVEVLIAYSQAISLKRIAAALEELEQRSRQP